MENKNVPISEITELKKNESEFSEPIKIYNDAILEWQKDLEDELHRVVNNHRYKIAYHSNVNINDVGILFELTTLMHKRFKTHIGFSSGKVSVI